MPWTVKAGVPEYVSWLESARVAILGTDYEWIGEYFWMLSEKTLATEPFCALGPFECEPLVPSDFLGLIGAGRVGGGVQIASLAPKMHCFLQSKMFEAYCENANEVPYNDCSFLYTQVTGVESGGDRIIANRLVPPCEIFAVGGGNVGGGQNHIVYWSTVQGQFQANVAQGGYATTLANGTPVIAYPWFSTNRWIWVNGNEGPAAWNFYACNVALGPGDPFEAPPLERPPYALTPPATTYSDVADLGKELDNLERKLHVVIEQGISTEIERSWPLAVESESLPVTSDEDVELVDVVGVIVTLGNIGNQVDEQFGEPRSLHRVGRIVFGTVSGWLAPIEITVTPQLFVGLPPGITRVRLHLLPPTTGSMQMVKRAKPEP